MNALKLADLNESSSRSLLQRAVPPCSPDFLSIYTVSTLCFKGGNGFWYGHMSQKKVPNWDANNYINDILSVVKFIHLNYLENLQFMFDQIRRSLFLDNPDCWTMSIL